MLLDSGCQEMVYTLLFSGCQEMVYTLLYSGCQETVYTLLDSGYQENVSCQLHASSAIIQNKPIRNTLHRINFLDSRPCKNSLINVCSSVKFVLFQLLAVFATVCGFKH
jgi:hypothetical protein